MANIADNGSEQGMFRAFGDQLKKFLDGRNMTPTQAATRLGVKKQRLNGYFNGKEIVREQKAIIVRPEAGLGFIYLVCTEFGFTFEYAGYRIRAEKLDGTPVPAIPEQLAFNFSRKFKLERDDGDVRVNVHRPPGRIELSVSLKANAS